MRARHVLVLPLLLALTSCSALHDPDWANWREQSSVAKFDGVAECLVMALLSVQSPLLPQRKRES